MNNESKVREQFEASVRDRGFSRAVTQGGAYENRMVQEWWETWQASRAAALEEAARAMHPEIRSMLSRGEAAAAIRAIAAKEGL